MRARARALAENDSGWNLKGCYCHFPPTRARIGGTGKLEVLGTLGRIYVSRPVAKTLVLDWKSWLAQIATTTTTTATATATTTTTPKQLCQSWFPIQNQSFGNRTTNIDPAQGSQNLQ